MSDFFTVLDYWRGKLSRRTITPWLVHGCTFPQQRESATDLPWNDLSLLLFSKEGAAALLSPLRFIRRGEGAIRSLRAKGFGLMRQWVFPTVTCDEPEKVL